MNENGSNRKIPRKRLPKNYQMRTCLGFCGKEFRSEGPHHRICSSCKVKQQSRGRCEIPHAVDLGQNHTFYPVG